MAINLANNNSLANITALPSSISGGGMTLISEQTASSSASISFTSGIDSTYDSYVFKFYNIHPATNRVKFTFQANAVGASGYNETMTTTWFQAYHNEADGNTALTYVTGEDQAQGTAFQSLCEDLGNDNDQSYCGELTLYNPSSTTFVKHFIAKGTETYSTDFINNHFVAGYFNTTSAIDEIQFKMTSGNIDSGKIKLYGIKDS